MAIGMVLEVKWGPAIHFRCTGGSVLLLLRRFLLTLSVLSDVISFR